MAYLTLGSTPCDEDCAQLGADDYRERMRAETKRYIAQLERLFPNRPEGVRFGVKGFSHDFGTYHEVCVFFNEDNEEQAEFAYNVEGECPAKWDDVEPQQA